MSSNTIRVAETQRDYADERRTETCVRCHGTGIKHEYRQSRNGPVLVSYGGPCPTCRGTGVVSYGEARR